MYRVYGAIPILYRKKSGAGDRGFGSGNHTNSAIINASSFINSSSSGSGGAIYINGSNVNVTNNKFTGSSANINGGVIYNNANIYLKNNTMENSNVVTPNGGKEI